MGKLNFTFEDCMRRATRAHRKPAAHHVGRAARRTMRRHKLYKFFHWLARSGRQEDMPG